MSGGFLLVLNEYSLIIDSDAIVAESLAVVLETSAGLSGDDSGKVLASLERPRFDFTALTSWRHSSSFMFTVLDSSND